MAALMFYTGHEIKARTHAHVKITHFPTWCITSTWKALDLQPRASQALMMHLVGKCAILRMGSCYIITRTMLKVNLMFAVLN